MKDNLYHYTECGLNNIYLMNGYSVDGDGILFIEDILGLHRAIGYSLILNGRKLKGQEIKFMRHHMDVSQKVLGRMLGVEHLNVLRWETGKTKITAMADKLLKILFSRYLDEDTPIKEAIDRISDIDNHREENIEFTHKRSGWKNVA